MKHSATYSPEDNKLRLYPAHRLDAEEYARVKAAGFRWAPKQELFVAPMWTPEREDLLVELCDGQEIGDEDKSLVERQEERAERFEDYSANRKEDAERAHSSVRAIADNIPLGQPILVGHHSERHARRDAEKIENGMRKAVKMWDQSEYWKHRAAGALRHAKYKELPQVRARRIKGLEADLRKCLRNKEHADTMLRVWTAEGLSLEGARFIAGRTEHGRITVAKGDQYAGQTWSAYDVLQPDGERYSTCPSKTVEEVIEAVKQYHARYAPHIERWIEHYSNRLEYEHAMLEEQGATGLLAKKPKSAAASLPLLNYKVDAGFVMLENRYHRGEMIKYTQVEMTQAEYAKIDTDHKGTRVVGNSHRVRVACTFGPNYKRGDWFVFITDSKVHKVPESVESMPAPMPKREDVEKRIETMQANHAARETKAVEAAPFEALRDAVKTGVKVVVANQLFPTPAWLADKMVAAADLMHGSRVLEPSAGTGALIEALGRGRYKLAPITAVEVNRTLCEGLRVGFGEGVDVVQADFLEISQLPRVSYDRVLMNPPFENGADIKHIKHALTFLKPGGRLVAICANGPRQKAQLESMCDSWEELPEGTFAGTGVRAVMLTIEGGSACQHENADEYFSACPDCKKRLDCG